MRVSTLVPALFAANAMATLIYVSVEDGTVNTLTLDESSGKASLTKTSTSKDTCGQAASWLTTTEDRLYCSSEDSPGPLTAYSFTPEGVLTVVATTNDPFGGTAYNGIYGGGKYIGLAHYGKGAITTYSLPLQNDAKPLQTINLPNSDSTPHQVFPDPSGKYIFSPDLSDGVVRIYKIDASNGNLSLEQQIELGADNGPRHVTFKQGCQADTQYVYIGSETSNLLQGYKVTYPADDSKLVLDKLFEPMRTVDTAKTPVDDPNHPMYIGEVQVKGNFLTVSNRNDSSFGPHKDSLAVFQIQEGGTLGELKLYSAGGSYPRSMAINKAGDRVAVGNQLDNTTVVLKRDPQTGAIDGENPLASVDLGASTWALAWGR
jgi:6-phosphogluconolactonase (cycloisomerase 2 family)